jgi:hypothetical protein
MAPAPLDGSCSVFIAGVIFSFPCRIRFSYSSDSLTKFIKSQSRMRDCMAAWMHGPGWPMRPGQAKPYFLGSFVSLGP